MTRPLGVTPGPESLVLPGGRWRPVYTWKDPHEGRLQAHTRSEAPIYLTLAREPDNEVDPNAILVYDKIGALGYLHGSLARWLAKPIDRLHDPVIVEGRTWSGPAAYVAIGGRNAVLTFLRNATDARDA